ncbi:CsbD family protein [Celeribacter halophilus]|uniref:CsbD family protein n=1 Tax=Celeribacter halophilus TaxID=576117 RepID=UPI002FD265F3
MNRDQFEGKWKEMKGRVREEWGDLTEDDLAEAEGNREQLEGKLQQRYGKSKEEVRKAVNEFIDKL